MKPFMKFLFSAFIIVIVVLFTNCRSTSKIVGSDRDSTKVYKQNKVTQLNDTENKGKIDTIKKTGVYCEEKDTNLTKLKNGTDYVELDGITYLNYITDSVPDILKEVFPKAYFVITKKFTYPSRETLCIYQEGKPYSVVSKFNEVYEEIGNKNVSFIERFTAFLYFQKGINSNIIINKEMDVKEKIPNFDYLFTKKVELCMDETDKFGTTSTYHHTFLICYENNQFIFYVQYWDNNFETSFSFYKN